MLKQKAASRGRGRGRGRGGGNRRGRGGRTNQRSAQESGNSSGRQETQDPETNTDLSGPQGEMAANENDVVSTNRGSSPVSDSGNSESESSDDSEANESSRLPQPAVSRFGRHHQVPSRYRTGSSDDSDNDGTLCCICNRNEPDGLTAAVVFWVDCSECGLWVHNHCAFGNNTASRKYSCRSCSE